MGDRTTVYITCLEANKKALINELEWWEPNMEMPATEQDATVTLCEFNEVNYAGFEDMMRAAKKGYIFYGEHHEGGDYGPAVFAAIDGDFYWAEATWDRNACVVVGDNGMPDPRALENVRAYFAAKRKVEAIFAGEDIFSEDSEPNEDTRPIHCRGRNRWFNYDSHEVIVWPPKGKRPGESIVDVYSTRRGKMAPIIFSGPYHKMVALFQDILVKLQG